MSTKSLTNTPSLAAVGVVLGLLLGGCPDPGERFDEFVDRTAPFAPGAGGVGTSRLADINGRFLLGAATNLSPALPLVFDTKVTMRIAGANSCPSTGCFIDLVVQPLAGPRPASSCPGARKPVGAPIIKNDIPVDADGTFRAELKDTHVDGCGNPISGTPIVADLVLVGRIQGPDEFCGDVEGQLIKPYSHDLSPGSTFGAVRLAPTDDPSTMSPLPLVTECPAPPPTGGTGGN